MKKSAVDLSTELSCYDRFVRELGPLLDSEAGLTDVLQQREYESFGDELATHLDSESSLHKVLESADPAELLAGPYGGDTTERRARARHDGPSSVARTLGAVRGGLLLLWFISPLAWSTKRTCRDAIAHIEILENGLQDRWIGRHQAHSLIAESAGCVGHIRNRQLRPNAFRLFAALSVLFALLSWSLALPAPPWISPILVQLGGIVGLSLAVTAVLIGQAWLLAGHLLRQLDQLSRRVHRMFDSADDYSGSSRG